MGTRESYEQTYNTGCNYDCVGDSVAAEEALTSDEKAIREYWEAEVGIIKVLETKLNSSQRTWKRRIVSDIITVCHGNILTARQRLVDVVC